MWENRSEQGVRSLSLNITEHGIDRRISGARNRLQEMMGIQDHAAVLTCNYILGGLGHAEILMLCEPH